ncbi:NAD(P)/FAD-dependent oxidoreductase [Luteibacter jiangsuensis]
MEYDVLVIGAGAAGLMTAIVAGGRGRRVLVVDHANRAGKKILMSGGGRCNFTNTATSPANFLSANPHFCKSALARYTPWDFIAMVDRHRIAWHEKAPGQLFCDDSSKQIVRMLLDECAAVGVRVETGCAVSRLRAAAGGFACDTPLGHVRVASLVVATGGLSIPSLGATGFGYEVAAQFGHALLPVRAGLVPLTLSGKHQERFEGLSGVALPVEARANGAVFRDAMLFTHRGLSGPAILQISSYWEPGTDLRIDLLPGRDAGEALREGRAERPAAELKTVLSGLLPRRLAERLCEVWLPNKPMRQFRDAELSAMGAQLADWPVVASGTEGYRTAEVTLGGVDTDEVSSSTMMSRRQPGLYFVGEVLDVTGHLGGYNFQWAWASGHAAGLAV